MCKRILTLNRASSKPKLPRVGLTIAAVLSDWGIDDDIHPLHIPVSRLLSGGAKQGSDGLFHLKACLAMLVGIHDSKSRDSFCWGKAPGSLQASGVATAFALSTFLTAALVDIRWAAFSVTREEAKGHVAQAIERLREEIGVRESRGVAL